jgi:hypothetical protein
MQNLKIIAGLLLGALLALSAAFAGLMLILPQISC